MSLALCLISSPSLPKINLLIALSISTFSNSSFSNTMPTFHTLLKSLALTLWSPKLGRQIIGTPSDRHSRVEFQPQWLQNPPTALCANTSFCGAHFTMQPKSPTVSVKPSGNNSIHSQPCIEPGLSTQRKGCLLLANPQAISFSSLSSTDAMLLHDN
ncbi:hypothetical protein CFOL_v3_21799 [Cephalotus follicularis]|uniref:Uncharacterized protein n=1 Tax=Cephalotus follicularis TaxID=3775 RepID=A0A1Q3CE24_CEPFO|nr:hypothetical protein CFOL_v3_21799 [Cephalotus follicularis]